MILDFRLQHQLLGYKGRPCVKLLYKAVENSCFRILGRHPQVKMISSDHLATADKEDLNHCIPFVRRQSQHILVLPIALSYFLSLSHLAHAVEQLPVLYGLFKIHLLCRLLHLAFQEMQHRAVISSQKFQCLVHIAAVFVFVYIPLAGCFALPNMVIQTGSFLSNVPWKAFAAASQMIQLLDQIYGILYSSRTGKGPEIFGFIFLHGSGKKYSGELLSQGYFNERIAFVILQHCVVFRPVLFNQIALQYQSLQL